MEQSAAIARRASPAVEVAARVSQRGAAEFGMAEPSLAVQYSAFAGNTRLSPAGSAGVGRSCRQGVAAHRSQTGGIGGDPSRRRKSARADGYSRRVADRHGGRHGGGMAIDLANAARSPDSGLRTPSPASRRVRLHLPGKRQRVALVGGQYLRPAHRVASSFRRLAISGASESSRCEAVGVAQSAVRFGLLRADQAAGRTNPPTTG